MQLRHASLTTLFSMNLLIQISAVVYDGYEEGEYGQPAQFGNDDDEELFWRQEEPRTEPEIEFEPPEPTEESPAKEVIALVNEARVTYGLKPVRENPRLSEIALLKAQDMRDRKYFDHTSPTYGSFARMIGDFGIRDHHAAENIYAGRGDAHAAFNAWMNSKGHRTNILNPAYSEIGVDFVQGGPRHYYWTQIFTGLP